MHARAYACTAAHHAATNPFHPGPVPAVLGDLGDLVYLDLASNALSGSLKPFADALAANANASSLMYLDVSDNRLSGNVPAGLSAAPLLDPSVRATLQQG